jgi:hypothetical protein
MIRFTDRQLQILMDVAASIDPGRRSTFLERCGAMLRMKHRFTDADVAKLAACGLIHWTDAV